MSIEIKHVDFSLDWMSNELVSVLNEYACDPMGGNKPLNEKVLSTLADKLSQRNDAISLIAIDTDKPQKAIGILNAFEGFSTFQAKPLLNIHDVYVKKEYRGQKVAQQLFLYLEKMAIASQCCKLTLEVLDKNTPAKRAYQKLGFSGYELDPTVGHAVFWQKDIG